MRLFIISMLAAFSLAYSAHAETNQMAIKIQGALMTIPNSNVKLELGKDTSGLGATQTDDGTLTIKLISQTPQSGFVIKGVSMNQFKVGFVSKGDDKTTELSPNLIGDHAFTYLPLATAMTGGIFIITLPNQPLIQKKNKAFLN